MTAEPRLRVPTWFWLSAALCAALSIWSLVLRHRVETRNRSVLLAAEGETLQTLALSTGWRLQAVVSELKQDGLGALVISEEVVGDLDADVQVTTSLGWQPTGYGDIERVRRALLMRRGGKHPRVVPSSGAFRSMAVGLDPWETKVATDAGLIVIARLVNVPGATPSYIDGSLKWARELGATVFLPLGEQVLGRRDSLRTTVESLERHGMLYASPEFAKIGGDANVVAMAPQLTVRLHAAQSVELDKLTLDEAVERYVKAARERNVRILLVRPVSLAGADPVREFGDLLQQIGKRLKGNGGALALSTGPARPFTDPATPRWLIALIGLAAVPAGFFAASALFRQAWVRLLLAGVLALLAGLAYASESAAQLAAFAAAVAFPTASLLALDGRRLRHPAVEFLVVSAVSIVGGLAAAGMLNGLPYLARALAFPGVKAAVFLPIAVAGLYYFARLANVSTALAGPITWGGALLGLVLLGALGFMLVRTGNEAPAGVSALELRFRSVLDQVLAVRPRTKEFLIGHPALVLGVGLLAWLRSNQGQVRRWGGWVAVLVATGAVGQTSLVNTLCHLHTPVLTSLWRIANGVLLGLVLGMAIWFIVLRRLPREG